MSTDINVRPVGGVPVATPVVRPQPDAPKFAVRTKLPTLPAPKIVTALDATVRIRDNQRSGNDNVSQKIATDRAAAKIVYSVVDNRTSLVERQYPDKARSRFRAYQRSRAATAKQSDFGTEVNQEA